MQVYKFIYKQEVNIYDSLLIKLPLKLQLISLICHRKLWLKLNSLLVICIIEISIPHIIFKVSRLHLELHAILHIFRIILTLILYLLMESILLIILVFILLKVLFKILTILISLIFLERTLIQHVHHVLCFYLLLFICLIRKIHL